MSAPVFPWGGGPGAPVPWALPAGEGHLHEVVADGSPWIDAAGEDAWPLAEAEELAAGLELLGYAVEVIAI
jgi:hypothetical protein